MFLMPECLLFFIVGSHWLGTIHISFLKKWSLNLQNNTHFKMLQILQLVVIYHVSPHFIPNLDQVHHLVSVLPNSENLI